MKILAVSSTVLRAGNGVHTVDNELRSSLTSRGHVVAVAHPGLAPQLSAVGVARIVRRLLWERAPELANVFYRPVILRWIRRSIRYQAADLMIFHDAASVHAAPVTCRSVLIIHGADTQLATAAFGKRSLMRRAVARERRRERSAALRVDQVYAVGADAARRASARLKRVVEVLPPPVPVASLATQLSAPVVTRYEPLHIALVGSLRRHKSPDDALHVLKYLTSRGVNAELILIGEGPARPTLERLASDLGLGHSVRFAGRVEDVSLLLRRAQLLIHTSRSETGPMVAFEAAALGLWVRAFDVGAIREVLGPTSVVALETGWRGLAESVYDLYRSASWWLPAPYQESLSLARANWDHAIDDISRWGAL